MGAADRSDVERPTAAPPIDTGCGSRIEAAAQAWALVRSTEILPPRSWKGARAAMGALAPVRSGQRPESSCDLVKCSDRFADYTGAGMEGLASAFGYGTSCKHDRNVLELIIKSKEKFKTPPMLDLAPYKHNLKKVTNKRKRAVSAAERKINQLVREESYALGKAYPSVISPYSNDIKDVRVMLGHIIMSREKSKAPLICHKEVITVASPLKNQFSTLSILDICKVSLLLKLLGSLVEFHLGREELTHGVRPTSRDACKGIDSYKD